MAVPVVATVGSAVTGSSASAAVPVPASVAANDLIIVTLFKQNNAAVTPPAGFTALTPQVPATDTAHYAWWKVASGADTGTYSFTWTGSTPREAVAIRITGASSTAPMDTGAGAPTSAGRATNGTVTPAVSLTTQGPDRLVVWSGANWTGGAWTPPSGYTERYDGSARLTVATVDQPSQGATGSITGTCVGSENETAYLIAVQPATISLSGSDSGTGSESGYAALLQTGSDSGTGSEDGYIAQPQAGSDTGTGSEGLTSLSATVANSDSGSGSESGSIAATVVGAGDTGTGTEAGSIRLPGTDAGTGTDVLGSLTANVVNSDTGTGAEGGYVDVLFGDLVVSVYAVNPSTGALLALPDFTTLTVAPTRNGPGSISLGYPEAGQNFASLYAWTIAADRDLEVEIWLTGSSNQALRGYLQEATGDDVDEQAVWTFGGGFLELRIAEAEVFPQALGANGNAKQEMVFSAATPGAMVGVMLTQAQTRGALTDITKGFSNTTDSDGVSWPSVVTTKFSPGSAYDQVLAKLVDLGLIEWGITWTGSARRLDMWIPGNRGVDLTTGSRPVVLRGGRNLVDAPRKWSVRNSGTAVLAAGAEGIYAQGSDANALSRRGRRIEFSASASNLSDLGAVQAYAGVQLAAFTPGILEVTHGLGFLPGEPRPVIAFNIGDYVYSQTGTTLDRLRVVEWSLTVDPQQNPAGTVTLNDSMAETLLKLRDKLNAMSSGDTIIGTSTSGVDTGVPNPPTSVTASSTAYLVGGSVRSSVLVGWTAPTQNTDGSTITDLAGFSVQYGFGALPTTWEDGATANSGSAVSASFSTEPGKNIGIRVRAFDSHGNNSAWSATTNHTTAADAGAPAVPSTPVVTNYLGVLKITWDGLTSTGADMLAAAPDFDHVDVHVSTSSGFAPSSSTYFDRLFAAGTQVYADGVYDTTYYAKLVAIDGSGNSSAASAQGSDVPQRVVSLDVFDGAIGTAKLADAAITTAKINNLAVNDAKIGDLSVGKLTAGILSVAVTLSGIIRTNTTGARFEADAAGIRLYNSSALTVNFKTVDGSALVTGQYQTALSGQRLVLNPGGIVPDTINLYPSGGGDFGRIMARTAPADGSAAVLIDGGAASGVSRGRLGAYRGEAFVSYVTNDTGGDTSAGFSRTAVSCNNTTINMWAQNSVSFDKYSGSSFLNGSHSFVYWANGGSSAYCPLFGASTSNAAVKLDSTTVCATTSDGLTFIPCKASSFPIGSAEVLKTDIRDARLVMTPLDVIRAARSKAWKYRSDVAREGDAAPLRFGPMAEDLPDELVLLTPSADGSGMEKSVELASQIGAVWAGLNQVLDQSLVNSAATVTPPPLITANVDVDVTVPWDDGPTQTVPAIVSIVPWGPGALQQRAVRARVVAKDRNGVTVRFRSKRALTGVLALDAEDRYIINAIYEFTPPPPA